MERRPRSHRGAVGCNTASAEPPKVSPCPGEAKRSPPEGQALTGHAKACGSDCGEAKAGRPDGACHWGLCWGMNCQNSAYASAATGCKTLELIGARSIKQCAKRASSEYDKLLRMGCGITNLLLKYTESNLEKMFWLVENNTMCPNCCSVDSETNPERKHKYLSFRNRATYIRQIQKTMELSETFMLSKTILLLMT